MNKFKIDRNSAVPLYHQLKEIIKNKIINDSLKKGSRLPSIRSLMKQYDVNLSLCKRATDELVKENWIYCHEGRGMFVAQEPETKLEQEKTKNIALVVPNLDFLSSSLFFKKVIEGIQGVLEKTNNTRLLFLSSNESYLNFNDYPYYLRVIKDEHIDGMLIIDELDKRNTLKLKDTRIDFILLSMPMPGIHVDFVTIDDFRAGYEGAKYLLNIGHKEIGLITGSFKRRGVSEFIKGYKYALNEHKINCNEKLIKEGDFTEEKGYVLTKELLKQRPCPTAIFACDDNIAVGIIKSVEDNGLKVPGNISVLGYNDAIEDNTFMKGFLTTLSAPCHQLGSIGIKALLNIMNKEKTGYSVFLKPEIIIRKSTKGIKK